MKYLVVVFVVLALVLAPIVVEIEWAPAKAAVLPWSTFSEAASDTTQAGMGRCDQGMIIVSRLMKDGRDYMSWYEPESGRVVFATFGDDGQPSEIGVGTIDPKATDRIPSLTWAKFDRTGLHAGGPCAQLFAETASGATCTTSVLTVSSRDVRWASRLLCRTYAPGHRSAISSNVQAASCGLPGN